MAVQKTIARLKFSAFLIVLAFCLVLPQFGFSQDQIKNIIFDFGGVLLEIEHSRTAEAFRRLGAIHPEAFYSQNVQHPIFENFESGTMDPQIFRNFAKEKLGIPNATDEEFDAAWNALIVGYLPEKIAFLRTLRTRYNIYFLSNTNSIHYDYFTSLYQRQTGKPMSDFEGIFKGAYYANFAFVKKPRPEIYQLVLNQNHLRPEETLFVDDTYSYVEGAKAVGMHALFLENGKTIYSVLEYIDQHNSTGKTYD